jgi:GH25 family lysozyme M1 (1,4-beta-N-acetylmuramidase)
MAKVYLLVCVVVFALLWGNHQLVEATLGVDVSQPTSVSAFSCLKNNGYHFAIVRGYQSNGHPDPNCPSTVSHAWSAGMSHVDVYMFPCPQCSKSAATQVREMVDALKGTRYGMIWFDIEGPQYWRSQSFNRQFMSELLSTAHSLGQHIGVYTSASQWGPIMGNWAGASAYPLWYAHYDYNPSFSDFAPFGGWSKPSIKQYVGDATVCGAGVDKNWYP